MKLAVFAVLLAIVQTAPPVPRQTSDDPTQGSKKAEEQAESNKTPTVKTTPKIATDNAASRNEDKGQSVTSENAQQTIGISKLPPVTVTPPKKDWADWSYWGFNFLLVVVGSLQAALLWGTIRVLRRQLAVPYRAYLGILEPDKPVGNHAACSVICSGRVPARISCGDDEIIIQDPEAKTLHRRSIYRKVAER